MDISNLRIGQRLGIGFGSLLILMVMMCLVALMQLSQVGKTARVMVDEELFKERITNEWVSNVKQNGIRTLAALKVTDPKMVEMYQDQISQTLVVNNDLIAKLEKSLQNPEGKARFEEARQKMVVFSKVRDEILDMKERGADLSAIDDKVKNEFMPARQSYFDGMEALAEFEREVINNAGEQIQSVKNNSILILMVLGAAAIIIGLTLGYKLSVGITRPLADAVTLAKAVANGDLTSNIQAKSKDEVGELLASLKLMNDNLTRIVSEVRYGTDTIETASSEIATGNLDLSSRTEEQASSLEETASAMEQLTSTVKQNADNASQANQLASSASHVAQNGGKVVDEVIKTMASINDSSKRIADIISVIDGIAFQTNILALNAAVEAARAGEQGRGFAVVATEVRSLAQRSANAAKEIKTLINNSVESVDAGSKQVEQAGLTMREVLESVQRVTDIVAEITSASQEQSTGIEQVNQAIMQMDEVTQQNAALVEEAAAASQSLKDQAGVLARAISVFKLADHAFKPSEPKSIAPAKALKSTASSKPATAANKATAGKKSTVEAPGEWAEF